MTSRPLADGPGRQVITVQMVDREVQLEPSEVTLQPGQIAIWEVKGMPSAHSCAIHFDGADRQGLGPFSCLHTAKAIIRGQGNTGAPGSFGYRAILRDAEGCDIASAAGTIENERAGYDPSPIVDVAVDLDGCVYSVHPETARMYPKGIVTFQFHGLAPSMVPLVLFTDYRALGGSTGESAGALGPFTACDQGRDVIVGHGSDGRFGSFDYCIGIVDLSVEGGRRITLHTSQDPVLDRLPEPIGEPDDEPTYG